MTEKKGAIEISFHPRKINVGLKYETIKPVADYSPWNIDDEFISLYQVTSKNTLVDKYRSYELWDLVGQVKNLKGAIIEIGVWRGGQQP